MKRLFPLCLACFVLFVFADFISGEDWPMWRYDAGRGNSSPASLPKDLHLHWVRSVPPAQPAWPKEQIHLQFDAAPQPIVLGERLFVPSTVNDSLTAYSTESGEELWRFYAEGPIRLAPVGYNNRVYFVSDDGRLYCVEAATGKLKWKVNGGPTERWLIGNDRLISSWPARGGPVLHQGKLFFTASIWPFMGIFIHAVDPDTGEKIWTNSGDGTNYMIHPHGAKSFGTVVPQGHLTATGDSLIVPGGRSTPAVYDTKTGKLVHFQFDGRIGGSQVISGSGHYFVGKQAYKAATGVRMGDVAPSLLDDQWAVFTEKGNQIQIDSTKFDTKITVKKDRKGKNIKISQLLREPLFGLQLEGKTGDYLLKAGTQIYTAGEDGIAAYDLGKNPTDKSTLQPLWSAEIEGEIDHLLAGDDRLFAVTKEGKIYCFGPGEKKPQQFPLEIVEAKTVRDGWSGKVEELLKHKSAGQGFGVVINIGSGRLIEELLRQSALTLFVIDPDAEKVDTLRRTMQDRGLYGKRISLHVSNPVTFALPKYLANLITSEDAGELKLTKNPQASKNLFDVLRPYGGLMGLELSQEDQQTWKNQIAKFNLQQAKWHRQGDFTLLVREGALPESDDWTHQYGNPGQTAVSRDKLVKAPLGLLWFGGPSHEKVLPRHGHGPSPQVAGGRLVIEGPDMLRAVDVYTGRVLWEKELKDFGKYYNITAHFPGAGEIGSNYVTLPDRVYAVYGNTILELDAENGDLIREYQLKTEEGKEAPYWGFVSVWGDYLIATSSPVALKSVKTPKVFSAAVPEGAWELIGRHADWNYLAGSDPNEDWTSIGYIGKGWKIGPAGFGYADNDDKTVLDMEDNYSRVYIRQSFQSKELKDAGELGLVINYDDAFIAYLNGKEILRQGVESGSGKKAKKIEGHEASGFEYYPLENWKELIRSGENVLAIEGHNDSVDSSDFTLDPVLVAKKVDPEPAKKETVKNETDEVPLPIGQYGTGSRKLVVFDRRSGELLWSREAQFHFRHNNIAAGSGKVFCIDSLTDESKKALDRRGIKLQGTPNLYALDIKTGEVDWSTEKNVFGTFLNYSEEKDILVQGGSKYRDRALDEVGKGMIAFRGKDGNVLWHNEDVTYGGPCLLWREKIITNGLGGFALDIHTGEEEDWKYFRNYGCNTALGGEHLLTFRSGCAGFFDLENESGTGNLGGFRSSCTNNLIIANGVLNAPDYTRTCTCAYQNQTSLALIHMPEAEFWTFGGEAKNDRVGINFGAPGDRASPNGTMWRAQADAEIEPAKPQIFRLHSSLVEGEEPKWVAASGVVGMERLSVEVEKGKSYKVRLVFLEPEALAKGDRVFDVLLQGKTVLKGFDIVAATESPLRSLIREFTVDAPNGEIVFELNSRSKLPAVLSGIEIVPQ